MQHTVKITSIENITHNVLKIVTQKPADLYFTPGQATEISINKDGWQEKKRPFTFTSIPENDYLEFTIKTYPGHRGVTGQLLHLKKYDELILHDVVGEIEYAGEGTFIAGGAGITPFISILRYLKSKNELGKNKLIFANKTRSDIILENEFSTLLGANFINILAEEKVWGYSIGLVTEEFIMAKCASTDKMFYLCGPPPMMAAVEGQLEKMKINHKLIIKEKI